VFESRQEPILPTRIFIRRLLACLGLALVIMTGALSIGVAGYHFIAELPWIDALLNAAMILTGMGPVDVLRSNAAKVFASLYALFSGVVFISLMGLLLSPIAHRVLHKFHLSDEDMNHKKSRKPAESRNQD
jgi:cytochrome c biogenesis protein CcdA